MKTTEIFAICMVMAVVSFLGFVVENVWLSITKGFIDNRNMYFPFLMGYGLAIVAIYVLFGTPGELLFMGKKLSIKRKFVEKLLYFLVVMLCVCLGEIVLGTLVEKICHFYWWDYSRLPMHITRYTSIPTSTGFTLMIIVFMEYLFVPLLEYFKAWEYEKLYFTATLLMVLMTGDFLCNAYKMYKYKKMSIRWRIDVTKTWGYRWLHSEG